MRLALITPGFSADETDWCIPALLDLVRELSRRHDVHVFTLRYPHRRSRYQVHDAAVTSLGHGTSGGLRRVPLLQHALAAILAEHRQRPFDLLHGLWADEPGFLAVAAGALLRRPAIVSLLGGELVGFPDIGYGGQLSRANRWLAGQALRRARRVTVGSRSLGTRARNYGVDEERLAFMPLGVDTTLFRPEVPAAPPLAGGFRLLNVASLAPVKDQFTLLRALALVVSRLPEVHLHVVGVGPEQAHLAALAGDLGVAGHVTFYGQISHDRLPAYYGAADLFVLSSRYESQSLVVLEAAACGCAVAGTSVGLLPDLVDGDHLAPPGDHLALSQAILRLLPDPARLAGNAGWVHDQVLRHYSLDQTVPALESLYRQSLRQT